MAEFYEACTSPTTKLWLMYMDMVMILRRFIHAERAGLWEEHLAEVEKMLPYLVAAGHYKYVSCLPYYLEAMRSLPTLPPVKCGIACLCTGDPNRCSRIELGLEGNAGRN